MMRAFAFAFALVLATPAFADDAAPMKIQASEAAQHVGETVTVIGTLTNVHMTNTKNVLWDVGGSYPDNPLTVFVSKRYGGVVPDVTPFVGKTIAGTGPLKDYHDKPEIEVTDPKQVGIAQ